MLSKRVKTAEKQSSFHLHSEESIDEAVAARASHEV
jgi:hypothetical protein